MAHHDPTKPFRWFTWTRLVLVVLAVLTILAITAYVRWNRVPPAYRRVQQQLDAMSPEDRRKLASIVEADTVTALEGFALDPQSRQVVRYGGPDGQAVRVAPNTRMVFRIGVREANAWLQERFSAWQQSQDWEIPEGMRDVRIAVVENRLHLMFHYEGSGLDQVFTLIGRLRVSDGQATIDRERVTGGTQSIPWAAVRSVIESSAQDHNRNSVEALLRALESEPFRPSWKARDDQQIELLDVRLHPEYIEFDYRFLLRT